MSFLKKNWPFFIIILLLIIFFWPFFKDGLLPIPSDITVGAYYPWLDYKWDYPTGVPIQNPLPSDIPSIIYPWRMAAIKAFKSGSWPLWNPSYFLGLPLLATFQSAVFSPSNLFHLLFSEPIAWSWGIITQSLLSLSFMYLYLKEKKLSKPSSLLGAIVFSFSGFAVVWHQYNIHGWTQLFLPLLLLLTEKYFKSKNKKYLPLISFSIALQIFSGYLPLVIFTWLIIGLDLLFQKRLKKFKKEFLPYTVFVVLGFLLASIQLLPGLELLFSSIRKIDPTVEASNAAHLPLRNLLTLIFPNFFGHPGTKNYWGHAFYDNYAFWIGSIPLALSLLALSRPKKQIWPLTLLVLGLLLSIKNPIGIFLEKLLFLSGGVSSRALFLTTFGFSVLTAFGLERLLKKDIFTKKSFLKITALLLPLLAFAVFYVLKNFANPLQTKIAFRNSLLGTFSLLAFLFLTFFYFNFKKLVSKPLFLFLIFSLTTFSLYYPARKYWSFTPERIIFPQTPITQKLSSLEDQPFRFEPRDVIPQNMWMPYGLETTSGYDTLLPLTQGEFLSLVETRNISKRISRIHLLNNFDSPIYPLLNNQYLLAKKLDRQKGSFSVDGDPPSFLEDSRYELVFEDKTVQIYKDNLSLPRFYFAKDIKKHSSKDNLVLALKQDNFDLNVTHLFDPNFKDENQKNLTKGEGTIEVLEYKPNYQKINLNTTKDSLLVNSISFSKNWKAYLDQKEISIYQTNYALQSYLIPAGDHQLEINYQPQSFHWGKIITLISFFFCTSYFFLCKKK